MDWAKAIKDFREQELAYSEKKKPYNGYVPKKTIIFRQRS